MGLLMPMHGLQRLCSPAQLLACPPVTRTSIQASSCSSKRARTASIARQHSALCHSSISSNMRILESRHSQASSSGADHSGHRRTSTTARAASGNASSGSSDSADGMPPFPHRTAEEAQAFVSWIWNKSNHARGEGATEGSGSTRGSSKSSSSKSSSSTNTTSTDPAGAARQRSRYKNSWGRKKVDLSSQLTWQHAMPKDPRVAIIGGGIAGLVCAQALAKQGIRSVVFDTGEHGTGGRLATRTTADPSMHRSWLAAAQQPPGSRAAAAAEVAGSRPAAADLAGAGLLFDHAAQYLTASGAKFEAVLQEWESEGAVQQWRGPVGVLSGGEFSPLADERPKYVARGGMRGLAQHVAAKGTSMRGLVEVRRPQWVARMTAVQEGGTDGKGGWRLTGNNRDQGVFDLVVIAHNGKCANRLVGPTGAPLVAQQLMRLRLSALWALMVAFDEPIDTPGGMEGAFVPNDAVLSWAANNTAKLQLRHPGHPSLSCWTLFSTNAYGQANKVPQEAVPDDVAAKVTGDMLTAFSTALGRAQPLPAPVFTRCQLWGAALPTNSPKLGCILDPLARVGACGDFCLGAGVESAVLSGLDLAKRIGGLRGVAPGPEAEALACGLHEQFLALQESGIGEIAGAPVEQQQQQQGQQRQGQGQQGQGGRGGRQGRGGGAGRGAGGGSRGTESSSTQGVAPRRQPPQPIAVR